ncbi:P-loop containing nucleoside triphosphate hydrolase protein [Diaporthe sp. PMI_573]|nr:P-loop containing nucleoside triphosphate hydrolase protein [Diaporthaceae sp. PMI_573]
MSIVDVFFPGLAAIPAATQQLGDMNGFARLLCVGALLSFLCGHVLTNIVSTVRISYSSEAHDVKPLSYSPWNGRFFFLYKRHVLIYRCEEKELPFSTREEISLSCLGRSPKILRELLNECRTEYLQLVQDKTPVFEHRSSGWKRTVTRDIRSMSTVVMDKKEKDSLLKDIGTFLNPRARSWYSNRGIPYRRGYLLYGNPGTGKSSFSLSLAGWFKMDIYIVSLSAIREDALNGLFAELPPRCVVLLEDVDAVNAAKSRETDKGKEDDKEGTGKMSLSSLLNVLDGVASQEGRLLIMTTNYIEKLDAALVRPGRVDKKVEFRLADKDTTVQLFSIVYKRLENDSPMEGKVMEDDMVDRLAKDFADKLPELEFSPAEIYWMNKTREEKKKVKRADSWVHPE